MHTSLILMWVNVGYFQKQSIVTDILILVTNIYEKHT